MSDNKPSFRRPGSWEKSYNINIDPVTKKHLKFFMANELAYYNTLITNATMRLRAFPEEVMELKEGYERLWNAIAWSGMNIRELAKIELKKWPNELRTAVPSSSTKNGKLNLSDRKMMLFDSISYQGKIHPSMRRAIASELFRTMIPQAEQLVQSQKNTTGQMRSPVHMLMPFEYPEKRHIQLTRDLIKIKWNPENRSTEITVPYTDKPLIVKDHNITDERFDMIVIRQQPNVEVNEASSWQITLLNTNHRYMMELTDQSLHMRRKRAA